MKTIKNKKTGEVLRVTNEEAIKLAGTKKDKWKYTSKSSIKVYNNTLKKKYATKEKTTYGLSQRVLRSIIKKAKEKRVLNNRKNTRGRNIQYVKEYTLITEIVNGIEITSKKYTGKIKKIVHRIPLLK